MPKTKPKRRQGGEQGPLRRSARATTQASNRSMTATSSPRPPRVNTHAHQEHLAADSLSGFLDLVREQVRAELRAQQASAPQVDEGQVTTPPENSQQATTSTGQSAATAIQPSQETPGTLHVRLIIIGVISAVLTFRDLQLPTR